jgi:hypothetical protein
MADAGERYETTTLKGMQREEAYSIFSRRRTMRERLLACILPTLWISALVVLVAALAW